MQRPYLSKKKTIYKINEILALEGREEGLSACAFAGFRWLSRFSVSAGRKLPRPPRWPRWPREDSGSLEGRPTRRRDCAAARQDDVCRRRLAEYLPAGPCWADRITDRAGLAAWRHRGEIAGDKRGRRGAGERLRPLRAPRSAPTASQRSSLKELHQAWRGRGVGPQQKK